MNQRRIPRTIGLGIVLAGVLATLALLQHTSAQSAERCFAETSFCVASPFRTLWEQGGLRIFGLPLGSAGRPATPSSDPNAAAQLQWFERQRIELHPANPAPYTLLLGRVGAERLDQLGRDWRQEAPAAPQRGCQFFAQTGRNLCPPFLAVWQANGVELDGRAGVSEAESLALFGLPLTEAREEQVEGKTYIVQWFERARFELHQESGTTQVLFGRLGAELLAGGAAGGTVPVAEATPVAETPGGPSPTAAPAGEAPTATRARPTATRTPRRATATPVPNVTVEPRNTAEPSSTSASAPATSTPRPTNTAVPPTSTPRPTSTRVPDPFPGPPATPPPGFPPDAGLPAQDATKPGDVANLDAATDTQRIGEPLCLLLSTIQGDSKEVTYTITGPDGNTAIRDQATIYADGAPLIGDWRWAPSPDYSEGVYKITASVANISGTITLTATGSIRLTDPAPGTDRMVRTVRLGDRISDKDVDSCNNGASGSPGDAFAVYLTGFTPREVVELHLFEGNPMTYKGLLQTITLDDQGQGSAIIATQANYPLGRYIIVTQEQAYEEARNPGYLQNSIKGWEQRLNLR